MEAFAIPLIIYLVGVWITMYHFERTNYPEAASVILAIAWPSLVIVAIIKELAKWSKK